MDNNRRPNFLKQAFYVGLDIHKRNWTVTIRSQGLELKTFSMNPKPEELRRYMQRQYPKGCYISAYEAGFSGFWIHRELKALGFENLVINPADIPSTNKERNSKTDKVDSRKLSRELEKHSLKSIYIPDELHQELRSLCRLRHRAVQSQTRVKNRIKAHLHTHGIELPPNHMLSHWSGKFITWLKTIEFKHKAGTDYLLFSIDELTQHRKRIVDITRTLRKHMQHSALSKQIELLQTVPGVGQTTALSFYTEIVDIKRFVKFDHLASFVGLVPSSHSSGDKSIEPALTQRRNRYLRHLIIEAAWMAVRKDPALLESFNLLTRRMKKQHAITRIAKKLLRRIRHVWKNQRPYVTAVVA